MYMFMTAIVLTALPTFLVIYSVLRVVKYFNDRENARREIAKLNKLYECCSCKKYHRKYQGVLKEKTDDIYRKVKSGKFRYRKDKLIELDFSERRMRPYSDGDTCPHCYYELSAEVTEEFEWTKYHIDCVALDKRSYRTFNETLEVVNQAAYEERSIAKFIEKNACQKEGDR